MNIKALAVLSRHQFMLQQMGSYCIAAYSSLLYAALATKQHQCTSSPMLTTIGSQRRTIEAWNWQRPAFSRQCP